MIKTKKPICPSGYNLKNAYKTKRGNVIQSRCIQNTGVISPDKSINKKLKIIANSKKRSLKAIKYSKQINIPITEGCKEGEILRRGYRRKSYNRRQGKYKGIHYRHADVSPGCIKKRTKNKVPKRKEKQKSKSSIKHKSNIKHKSTIKHKSIIKNKSIIKRSKRSKRSKKSIKKQSSSIIILDKDDHLLSEYGYFDVANKSKSERILSLHKLINYFLPIKGEMATYNYIIKALNARYILNKNSNPKTALIFKSDQKTISKYYKTIKNK